MSSPCDVALMPYQRGAFGRDTLYRLFVLMEEDGRTREVFYAQQCTDERTRGDLVEFASYFSQPARHLLMVYRAEGSMPFGLVWFDAVAGQPYALMGLWYARHTTRAARRGTALAMDYALDVLGYESLRGFTPHKTAVYHTLPLGWHLDATLPRFTLVGGQMRDIYVLSYHRKG